MTWTWNAWTLIPTAVIVAAAALGVWARRGRRVDRHPVCRRCGFDLFGKPKESARCPECGANVRRWGSVRVGNRATRRRVMAVAAGMVLAAGGWLGLLGWGAARGTEWNRHKPVWVLAWEAGGKNAYPRDAALDEIVRRIKVGKISDDQLADLTTRALAHQADAAKPWVPGWGFVIEAAQDAARLPREKWERYALNGFPLRMTVRAVIRRGDPIPVEYAPDPPRVASQRLKGRFDVTPVLHLRSGVIQGPPQRPGGELGADPIRGHSPVVRVPRRPSLPGGGRWHVYDWPEHLSATLADGPQTATLHYRLSVADGAAVTTFAADRTVTAAWQLLPADRQSTALESGGDWIAAPGSAFTTGPHTIDRGADDSATVTLAFTRPPLPAAFDVMVRQGDREWPAGSFVLQTGFPALARYAVWKKCPGLAEGTADVILRPSPAAAASTLDVMRIWGDEIVLKDVPVSGW